MTMQILQHLRRSAIAALMLAAGCNAIADIEDGRPRQGSPCATLADCTVEVPECRSATACEQGRCVFQDAIEGTPLSMQTPGDCTEMQCDGAGQAKAALAPADISDDGNPCTLDACDSSTPAHLLQMELPCYTGPGGTENKGICHAGTQHCDAQGNPIGGCEGEVLPEAENCLSLLDDDCDGQLNEEGAACACKPGDVIPCYTGPAGTLGVGACHGGLMGCQADGLGYGPCGEQTPELEDCDAAMTDEDCDGLVNEQGVSCTCGDGYVSASLGEACDDGNLDSDDACNVSCQVSACGDGYVQPSLGEACDDGNLDSTDTCTADCQHSTCGDGYQQPGESCDDGNTMDGDACPASCLRSATKLTMSVGATCALLDDGRLKCWGASSAGALGLGDKVFRGDDPGEMGDHLPAVDLGTGEIAVALDSTQDSHCALLMGGRVKCWGANSSGELGLGDNVFRGDDPGEMGDNLPVVDLGTGKTAAAGIQGGFSHRCAILTGGSVKCWGNNGSGRLGLGNFNGFGDNPFEMGDSLPVVDLGTGKTAVQLALGDSHTCALLNDQHVKCWGGNYRGQLGLGDIGNRGGLQGQMGDYLPEVDLGTGKTAAAISASAESTCALLNDGSVKCWGLNAYGQLGQGHANHRGDQPGEMGDNLPAVDLGTGKTAVAIAGGNFHVCALLNDGSVKCWGHNSSGQLGLGDTGNRGDQPGEMGDNLPAVDLGAGLNASAIETKYEATCALLEGGRLKCWGRNTDGDLGLGDTTGRGDNPGEMGNHLPFVTP